jgi:hypothetical protein
MNLKRLSRDPRLIKALTGLSHREFEDLVPTFEKSLHELRSARKNRKRKVGGGKKGKLPTMESKLFFILFYLKAYPTFDVLGFLTDRERSHCCESVQELSKVLEMTLGKKISLPKRKIHSVEEFLAKFPEAKDVFLDGTERRIQRPKSTKRNKRHYSGKKKTHTRKNLVMTNEKKRILLLSPTKSGRRHDKRLQDKIALVEHIPKRVGIWTDSGFQGIQHKHPNTLVAHKGRKDRPLTKEQRAENKIIASFRMGNEHAIGGMKRYRALTDVFRNKIGRLDDLFALLGAGLWNYHLQSS